MKERMDEIKKERFNTDLFNEGRDTIKSFDSEDREGRKKTSDLFKDLNRLP